MKKPKIALHASTTISNELCALCSGECESTGLDFMIERMGSLVCDVCAKEYAPDLVDALEDRLAWG